MSETDNTTVKQEQNDDSTSIPLLPDNLASMLSNLQNLIPTVTPTNGNETTHTDSTDTNGVKTENGTKAHTDTGTESITSIVPTDKYSTALQQYIQWFRGTIEPYTIVQSDGTIAATTVLSVQLPNGIKFTDNSDTSVIRDTTVVDACTQLSIELLKKLFVSATQRDNSDSEKHHSELLELAQKYDLQHTMKESDVKPALLGTKRNFDSTTIENEPISSIWKSQSAPPYILHIKNIPNDTTVQDILNYFSVCELNRVWLNNVTNECYVEFMSIHHAMTGYQMRYTKPLLKPNTERFSMFDVIKTAVPYVEPEIKQQLDQLHYSTQAHNTQHKQQSVDTTVQTPVHSVYKSGICKMYINRNGLCQYGMNCKYAHTVDQLQPDKRIPTDPDFIKLQQTKPMPIPSYTSAVPPPVQQSYIQQPPQQYTHIQSRPYGIPNGQYQPPSVSYQPPSYNTQRY